MIDLYCIAEIRTTDRPRAVTGAGNAELPTSDARFAGGKAGPTRLIGAERALAVAALLALSSTAGAQHTISLLPAEQNIAVGEQVAIELWWDFPFMAPFIGGNDVFYDATKLRYISYTWNPSAGNPGLQRDPDLRRSELNGIAAGFFPCTAPLLIRVGTIVFEAIREGTVELVVTHNDAPVGPMISCGLNFYPDGTINFDGATINIGISDSDGDGVFDNSDNCTDVFNPSQYDSNGDDIGNSCDADITGPGSIEDCTVNFLDLEALKAAFFSNPPSPNWDPHADFDGNGQVNFADLQVLKNQFFGPPGPSAFGCN